MKGTKNFETVWRRFNGGQEEAFKRKLWLAAGGEEGGEERLRALLRDEFEIQFVDRSVKFFDTHGIFIPPAVFKNKPAQPNRDFTVDPLTAIDHAAAVGCYETRFPGLAFPTVKDFKRIHAEILEDIRGNKQTANILRGPSLPICLPVLKAGDYGTCLEQTFLPAVKASYEGAFPGRKFYNHRAGTLAEQVRIVSESRHQRLIDLMGEGPVVGLYFPRPLQGFSIPGDIEAIGYLPENYLLSGGVDAASAFVAYPRTLAAGYSTTCTDCAALNWRDSELTLHFCPSDGRLDFSNRVLDAYGSYSGGVLVLPQGQGI